MTREELADLYAEHGRRLFGLAWQLTGNAAEAEDAVQEAFLRALRGLAAYREQGRARAWLDRILVHVVREKGRRQSLYREKILPRWEAENPGRQDPDPSPESRAVSAQGASRVLDQLPRLPRTFREILVLRHFREQTTRETAEALDLPLATVRSRLRRARQMLIRMLEGEEGR